jgi:hypothetical protein
MHPMTRNAMVSRLFESELLSFESASADPDFAAIAEWIERFLCAPNAALGRSGDVCPFSRVAVSRNTIQFFRNRSESVAALERDIELHLEAFMSASRSNLYDCRIIVPVGIENADRAVEDVQARWKPRFVEHHLMIGQFYPDCQKPGLWNREFRPLQSPVPLIAIRNMVLTDIAFLYHDEGYVQRYMEKFGERGGIALRQFQMTREAHQ